ncbi:MAG: DUF1697 domain-containing protein [Bacteroidetes bacterium]|nr:DUF1697 domain-containing protein [Bacteroidota bacterium]
MTKYISILRGINVGGKRKILMDDLRKLYENLGFSNITTYIQSGNVIFDSKEKLVVNEIENLIQQAIFETSNFDVPVIVRTLDEIVKSISNNPFTKEKDYDIERLYLTFLKENPTTENLEKLKKFDFPLDKFEIIEKDVFGYCSGKFSDSKITNNFFESKLKVVATTRNWKTVNKLFELATN